MTLLTSKPLTQNPERPPFFSWILPYDGTVSSTLYVPFLLCISRFGSLIRQSQRQRFVLRHDAQQIIPSPP